MSKTLVTLRDVRDERNRQDEKWGEQNHENETWMTILAEEVGELAQEVLRDKFGKNSHYAEMRAEAIQVAAVAVAFVECIDRRYI